MQLRKFKPDAPGGQALAAWHAALAEQRGDRAQLRRAADATEAALVPATHRLIRALRDSDDSLSVERVPLLAMMLAQVKEIDSRKVLPLQLAQRAEGGERAAFSELRLRRLLQSEDREALCTDLRRAIAQLRGKADIYSLAETIYFWGDPMRRAWSYDYFGANDNPPNKA